MRWEYLPLLPAAFVALAFIRVGWALMRDRRN